MASPTGGESLARDFEGEEGEGKGRQRRTRRKKGQ